MRIVVALFFASLFCDVVLGQRVAPLAEVIPRDKFRATELIRESGSYSGSSSFRVVDAFGADITIQGDGDSKLDVSTVQQEGEAVYLDTVTFTKRRLSTSGISTVSGSSGPDFIFGGRSDNRLRGFGGDDIIQAIEGSNILSGGAGNDILIGSTGSDLIRGGMDDDTIVGSSGNDNLSGGSGADFIYGGAGDDILRSGPPGTFATFRRPRQVASRKASSKKDVIFVIFDDLAKSLYADSSVVMPNLSRFANTSVDFTNAYANSPICNPSRASLLTGLYPRSSGVFGPLQNEAVPTSHYIQKHLQANGFEVGEFGKVRNHTVSQNDIGLDDHFFRATQVRGARSSYGVITLADRDEVSAVYSDAAAVDAAKLFLDSERTGPRATFLGLTRPHAPWIVPDQDWAAISAISDEEIRQMAADKGTILGAQNRSWLDSIPSYVKTSLGVSSYVGLEGDGINLIRHYLASARFADRLFGEFMESVPDDVTVIVTSDHGMHLADRRSGLSKATLWPQALRVPLLIRNSGFAAGERSETVGLIDLYGTITDLAGVDRAPHVEGRSLETLLRRLPDWERISVATVANEYATRAPSQDHGFVGWSVSHNNWHFIRYEDGSQELYHLSSDPNALRNIAESESVSGVINWLSTYLPRDSDFLYGGAGSDYYVAGGGEVLINEGSNRSDEDEVFIFANHNELQFAKVVWGNNSQTMRVNHPGGSVYLYDQYSEDSRQIETLSVRDGYFDLTDEGVEFHRLP